MRWGWGDRWTVDRPHGGAQGRWEGGGWTIWQLGLTRNYLLAAVIVWVASSSRLLRFPVSSLGQSQACVSVLLARLRAATQRGRTSLALCGNHGGGGSGEFCVCGLRREVSLAPSSSAWRVSTCPPTPLPQTLWRSTLEPLCSRNPCQGEGGGWAAWIGWQSR